jgi:hypothetical protein
MQQRFLFGTFLSCWIISLGCGDSGPKMYPVSGRVTWQGEPLATGQIVFEPVDKQAIGSSSTIEKGEFVGRASAGSHRVKIFATRPAPQQDQVMGQAPQEQFLPAMYNHETELTAEVVATGENQLQFELTKLTAPSIK